MLGIKNIKWFARINMISHAQKSSWRVSMLVCPDTRYGWKRNVPNARENKARNLWLSHKTVLSYFFVSTWPVFFRTSKQAIEPGTPGRQCLRCIEAWWRGTAGWYPFRTETGERWPPTQTRFHPRCVGFFFFFFFPPRLTVLDEWERRNKMSAPKRWRCFYQE